MIIRYLSLLFIMVRVIYPLSAQIQLHNDEFQRSATLGANWSNINQEEGWMAEHLEAHDVDETSSGHLYMMPWTTSWYEDLRGTLLFKLIDQDFVITTEVTALNRAQNGLPSSSYSLAGVMLRTPRHYPNGALSDWTPGGENYVFLATGFAATNHPSCPGCQGPHFEVKSTINSNSNLQVSSIPTSQNVQIRVARIGSAIIVLNRMPGGSWQVHQRYDRTDFPSEIQVGLVTYTDWEKVGVYWQSNQEFYHNSHVINDQLTDDPAPNVAFNPDLIGEFDFVRFDSVSVPPGLSGINLVNTATDMQLLSFLGYETTSFCPENFVVSAEISQGQIVETSAQNSLTASNRILSQAMVYFTAGFTIDLQPGFEVEAGAEFQANIGECSN